MYSHGNNMFKFVSINKCQKTNNTLILYTQNSCIT